ncbi:IucA/IucC family C-terminal-domain containing protein [Paenibacillus sp. MBLB4367]|uniref:IucA/IucC family C-terminal-domain containing protein n=1 Tax=Paenibacillus sp. MBLB4367 TaxID=3384767 RepID=UPI0039082C7F
MITQSFETHKIEIHKIEHELAEKFDLLFAYDERYTRFAPGGKLTDPHTLRSLVDAMCTGFGTDKRAVAASLSIKHLSRALCGILYAMSVLNRSLDGSLGNMELLLPPYKGVAPMLVDAAWTAPSPDTLEAREAWREQTCRSLFEGFLKPYFEAMSRTVKLSKQTMWENTVVYIHFFYKEWLKAAENETARERLADDYRYVTETAPGTVFGIKSGNPLSVKGRSIPHPVLQSETLRIRQTCCLRLQLPDGSSCTTCPRISDDARSALLAHK